jgi:hypothetical protein
VRPVENERGNIVARRPVGKPGQALLVLALLLFPGTLPLTASDQPPERTAPGAEGPALNLQISGRDAEITGELLRLLSLDLSIFAYRVSDPDQADEALGTLRLKVSSSFKKTAWRGETASSSRLETRHLVFKGSFKSEEGRTRLLEEDVAGCFLTDRESLDGGLFQRTRQTADGVWLETDTSLLMRLIRRIEIDIFGAMASEQSIRALLALYWEFPDMLGPRILDTVRSNRKRIIPVLESLYATAQGSEKAAAAAILARYAD